jgi:hypothetical protein
MGQATQSGDIKTDGNDISSIAYPESNKQSDNDNLARMNEIEL